MVTGECFPFSPEWLDRLDKMTKDQALEWVELHIDISSTSRDLYEGRLLTCKESEYPGYLNAYVIDSNNVVRFTKLYRDIREE